MTSLIYNIDIDMGISIIVSTLCRITYMSAYLHMYIYDVTWPYTYKH